jgi:hypothetical protein
MNSELKTENIKDEKWCLITIVLNLLKDKNELNLNDKQIIKNHLNKLKTIDPDHQGYYNDIMNVSFFNLFISFIYDF